MANPEHTPTMDSFDNLTVVLYRIGISICAMTLLIGAIGRAMPAPSLSLANPWAPWALKTDLFLIVGIALSVTNVHLYAKVFRWIFSVSAWLGAVLLIIAPGTGDAARVVACAGLGFLFVTLSAFALKERLCFRIPGLRLVPFLLAVATFANLANATDAVAITMGLSGLILSLLAFQKWRMPLHFDVGDKSAYEI
jgi:uncharacterized integral membrane protein